MKRSVLLLVSAALGFGLCSAQAAEDPAPKSNFATKKSVESPAPKAKAAVAAAAKVDPNRAAMKKRIEEKKKELNGSRWDITLTAAGEGGKSENDEVTFQDGKVSFGSFSDKGFGASNYTISLPEGSENAVWETMQNSEKGGVLFVRGEWSEEAMSGVISQQNTDEPEKPARDYTFTTRKKTAIDPETKKKPEEGKAQPENTGASMPALDSVEKTAADLESKIN